MKYWLITVQSGTQQFCGTMTTGKEFFSKDDLDQAVNEAMKMNLRNWIILFCMPLTKTQFNIYNEKKE